MRELLRGTAAGGALLGRSIHDLLVDPAEWVVWQRAFRNTSAAAVATRLRAADGTTVALRGDVRAARSHGRHGDVLCGVFVDDAVDGQMHAVVQQGARMEALGSLTAGIAHDFNNLLTVLVGNLYLVVEDVRDNPKLFEKLKAARDAGKRGADLIRQLLAFARREHVEADIVDPTRVVEELLPLLRRALGARIKLEAHLEAGAGPIRASVAQLESVFVNLAMNARDAIEKKGTIVIQVAVRDLSAPQAKTLGLARSGGYVAIEVSDDGCGIPPEALERIFEPFFSTKTERGGTGLGLSMVRWFAEHSGGAVRIDSSVGKGTTVSLLVPVVAARVAEATDKTMPLSTLPGGSETILVLAAEEALSSTIRQILEVLGYTVKFAGESERMLAMLGDGRVDVLVVDASLRTDDLVAKARSIAPHLKMIVTTDGPTARERRAADTALLMKPFSLADLAKTVRGLLDSRSQ
jgi:signal transduction histidine kinase/CheY-like chemotaxis protein